MDNQPKQLEPSGNAYFNALLRETDSWAWHPGYQHFLITHPVSGETLHIPCRFRSVCGRHLLGKDVMLDSGAGPIRVDFLFAVDWTLTLPELIAQSSPEALKKFQYRVKRSEENLNAALAYRAQYLLELNTTVAQTFIESEQSLVNGHSIHPCPKDRENMNQEEARIFAPEYRNRFPLIWYSVDPACIHHHEATRASMASAIQSLLQRESPWVRRAIDAAKQPGHIVIPCHPFQHHHWQAHPTLRGMQAEGRLQRLCTGSSLWCATSSLRAIWGDEQDWMIKFSLSVRITNSLRHLQPQEALRGAALADLLETAPAKRWLARHPQFRVLNEPIATAICDGAGNPLPETTLVFRDNPFQGENAKHCELLASLLQDDPVTGVSRLGHCLKALNAGETEAATWFRRYLDLAVKPLLDAQSNLGLLFGAHQQNLILRLDEEFQPVAAWFRDCQGTGFSALAHRVFGAPVAAVVKASGNELPDALGVKLFSYYLFINSTFNVITALAAAGLCLEARLVEQLKKWLQQRGSENPTDSSAIHYLLNNTQLYAKNNFLCSLRAVNENTLDDLESIYHPIPNPLVHNERLKSKEASMTLTYSPINVLLSSNRQQLQISLGDRIWQARHQETETISRVLDWEGSDLNKETSHRVLDALFYTLGKQQIELHGETCNKFDTAHPAWEKAGDGKTLFRSDFYQIRENWLDPALWPVLPERMIRIGDLLHPQRPALQDQILYRRFAPGLGKTITLRQATVEEDGERFHRWQNSPRVAKFWEYPWSRERLNTMLEERRADPHSTPLILEADGEAVGYFETYYVVEDRLGPYCDASPYDQGMHVLVGEEAFLGNGQTPHWLNAVSHFLFLAEPRTQHIWGEPKADNKAMLRHIETMTWEKRGEFDFPHKRAALLCNPRDRFFLEAQL